MIREDYKQLIVDTGIEMLRTGITVGTWGNISARDPDTGLIYISPSGMEYEKIGTRHVVVIDSELEIIDGQAEPSIEKQMHVEVYRQRDDVNAVIHTHPTFSTVCGIVNNPLPAVSEDFAQIVGAEVQIALPYALPGTKELAVTAVEALGVNNAVILPGHGALSVGKDMKTALKVSHVLEKNARIYLYARLLGGEIRLFSPEEIDAMQSFAGNVYGRQNMNLE